MSFYANGRARSWGGATVCGPPRMGRVYVCGGCMRSTGVYLNTVECYNPNTRVCTSFATMLYAPAVPLVVRVGGLVYAIGGNGSDRKALISAECYDPVSNRWTLIPPMITARTNHCGVAFGGRSLLFFLFHFLFFFFCVSPFF